MARLRCAEAVPLQNQFGARNARLIWTSLQHAASFTMLPESHDAKGPLSAPVVSWLNAER